MEFYVGGRYAGEAVRVGGIAHDANDFLFANDLEITERKQERFTNREGREPGSRVVIMDVIRVGHCVPIVGRIEAP